MDGKVISLRPAADFSGASEPEEQVFTRKRYTAQETPMSFAANLDPEDEAQTTYYIYDGGRTYELGPDGLKPKP